MAPEQMQQGVRLDARADIYALGTIAYHMLGGRPPFTGDITQLIAQKLTAGPTGFDHAAFRHLDRNRAGRNACVGKRPGR